MAGNRLPYHKRVQDALDKLCSINGTKIPDAALPDTIDKKNNTAVNAFFDNHAAVKRFLFYDIVRKHADGRYEHEKKQMLARLSIDPAALSAGDTRTFQFDNVNISYKVTNGRALLNREHLIGVLMMQMSKLVPGTRNLTLEEASKVVEASTVTGKAPLSLIPSTTAE